MLMDTESDAPIMHSGVVAILNTFQHLFIAVKALIVKEISHRSQESSFVDKCIKQTLVIALMYVVCSDLPPDLPCLIVSGISDRYSCMEALDLTKAYVESETEDYVLLVLSMGMFGFYGFPCLPTH